MNYPRNAGDRDGFFATFHGKLDLHISMLINYSNKNIMLHSEVI